MERLFDYQHQTKNEIKNKFIQSNLVALLGEKACGKSNLVGDIDFDFIKCKVVNFIGTPYNRYTDYGCFPEDILKKFNSLIGKERLVRTLAKDIASTISNVAFLSFENTLDTLLSKNDKEEMENLVNYFTNLDNSDKCLFVFDNIDDFDNKSILFLYKILALAINHCIPNIKILVVLDTSLNSTQNIISTEYLSEMILINIASPTDEDLRQYVDSSIYTIARYVPIKYLLELKDNCSDITHYYNNKLNQLSTENKFVKKILLPMSLLDDEISVSDLIMFLPDLTNYELLYGLSILEENNFLEKVEIGEETYFKIPKMIRENVRKSIPEYFALHRFEIFARQLEKDTPFNYMLKCKMYLNMRNYENFYANAILSYCATARGEMPCTNEDLALINNLLDSSSYKDFFDIIKEAYGFYNQNEYGKCFSIINDFLIRRHIWENKKLLLSIYLPEFILELIFLKAMCTGRVYDYVRDIIEEEILLLKFGAKYADATANSELTLRIQEEKLLLQSYISDQSKKQQLSLYNEYFCICDCYKNHIRTSKITELVKWEMRYASFLLKINIISGVSNKLQILGEGYSIVERNKLSNPTKYLKAACNYAGDLIWRNEVDTSYKILDDAIKLILERGWLQKWGIVYQMYIFSRLYKSQPDNPLALIEEYNSIWLNNELKSKMHEPLICNSNYAILLAATGNIQDAKSLLGDSLEKLSHDDMENYNKYLLQTNLAAVEYLCGNIETAKSLETSCKKLIDSKLVPTFSYPFLQKRYSVMMDIYSGKIVMDNVLKPHSPCQILSTGYCSDNYTRLLLFSDINYWTD